MTPTQRLILSLSTLAAAVALAIAGVIDGEAVVGLIVGAVLPNPVGAAASVAGKGVRVDQVHDR